MIAPGGCVFSLAALLLLGPLPAITWESESNDEYLAIWAADSAAPGARPAESPGRQPVSDLLHNCVPLEDGRLRCYTADPNAAGILAVTVDPGAAGANGVAFAGAVASEFRQVRLQPAGIELQPNRGWTLVNVDTIVMAGDAPQSFPVTVLGIPVTIRAVPVRYTWSFDDGSPALVTTDPGTPWPEPTVAHRYTSEGERRISLTTEWGGEYQVGGSASWTPIPGVATTTETAPPLEVREAHNLLVQAP